MIAQALAETRRAQTLSGKPSAIAKRKGRP
jgi:hypothetical protein